MFCNLNNLLKFKIVTKEGAMGHVHDIFFDDHAWKVRYFVDSVGSWFHERQVLVAPVNIREVDWENHELKVDLTKEQVGECPEISQHKPICLQKREALDRFYTWPDTPMIWDSGIPNTSIITPPVSYEQRNEKTETVQVSEGDEPNLRSVREVEKYHIEATDGAIGHLENFLVEEDGLDIRYLVVNTHNWTPGRKVLIAPQWIRRISWDDSRIYVGYDQEHIRTSPEFDPTSSLIRQDEKRLYDYYQRPYYWSV